MYRKFGLFFVVIALLLMACTASRKSPADQSRPGQTVSTKDINDVLREHDQDLMAIPGVVGVFVGLLPDEETPCLKVLVIKKNDELEKKIPKTLDGYPVVIEESGAIRPMN